VRCSTTVIGALLLFSVIFNLVSGIQILASRMMDARKTFVVGVSVVLGLSVDLLPGAYQSVPGMFLPAFTSSLSVSTISALLLNLLFRIGIAQRAKENTIQSAFIILLARDLIRLFSQS
jgi:NCS2 family nucleobase:cation symporter-2